MPILATVILDSGCFLPVPDIQRRLHQNRLFRVEQKRL